MSRFQVHIRISQADEERVKRLVHDNPSLLQYAIPANRNHLLVTFLTKSPTRVGNRILLREKHLFKITCPPQYPDRMPPLITVQGDAPLHPNIGPDGRVHLPHWGPTMSLADGIAALWQLLTYQHIDNSHILNEEAFRWVNENKDSLPLNPLTLQHIANRGERNVANNLTAQVSERPNYRKIEVPAAVISTSSISDKPLFKLKGPIRYYKPEDREYPWSRPSRYPCVVLREAALYKIKQHGRGDMHNERFGLLIGAAFSDPSSSQPWVEIVDMLPARRVRANHSQVEVQPEELITLRDQIEEYVDHRFREVGWYHTHPGHGIFMSGTDRVNQKHNYTEDWHLALVYDPTKDRLGIFSGNNCLEVKDIEIVPDQQAEREWEAWQPWEPLLAPEIPDGQTGYSQPAPEASRQPSSAPLEHDSTSSTVPRVVPTQPPSRYWTIRRLAIASALGLLIFLLGIWLRGFWENTASDAEIEEAQLRLVFDSLQALNNQDRATAQRMLETVVELDANSSAGILAQEALTTLSGELPTPPSPTVARTRAAPTPSSGGSTGKPTLIPTPTLSVPMPTLTPRTNRQR